MRTMSTQVGTTGSDGRPEGLSEVQESLLEYAAPEAGQKEELAGNVGAVKLKPRMEVSYQITVDCDGLGGFKEVSRTEPVYTFIE